MHDLSQQALDKIVLNWLYIYYKLMNSWSPPNYSSLRMILKQVGHFLILFIFLEIPGKICTIVIKGGGAFGSDHEVMSSSVWLIEGVWWLF